MSWPFKLNPPGLPEGSEKRDRAGTAPVRCALGNPADPNEPARFDRLRAAQSFRSPSLPQTPGRDDYCLDEKSARIFPASEPIAPPYVA